MRSTELFHEGFHDKLQPGSWNWGNHITILNLVTWCSLQCMQINVWNGHTQVMFTFSDLGRPRVLSFSERPVIQYYRMFDVYWRCSILCSKGYWQIEYFFGSFHKEECQILIFYYVRIIYVCKYMHWSVCLTNFVTDEDHHLVLDLNPFNLRRD